MSSATRSLSGLIFSKNSSGGTSRPTAAPPRIYGAALPPRAAEDCRPPPDRRPPCGLVRPFLDVRVSIVLGERLDGIEVDVGEVALLLLVETDAAPPHFRREPLARA